ncbi:hypothetical protein AC578_7402 [Pseudocercospora eumusae]|uniref:Uncharacterized protein n=1 Tax=Pseudocercospora eumusae TaxID=321146 RepID=A0A139H3A9_9PEZI|nr:hypothetical protein AC578_7402 [Pseudocercospora eumusae]
MPPPTGNDYLTHEIYHSKQRIPQNVMRDNISYNDIQISECQIAELKLGSLHIRDFGASNIRIGKLAIDHMWVDNGDEEAHRTGTIDYNASIRDGLGPAYDDDISVASEEGFKSQISPDFRPRQSIQIAEAQALESQLRAERAAKRSERSRAEHLANDQASHTPPTLYDSQEQAYAESVFDLNTTAQPDVDVGLSRPRPGLISAMLAAEARANDAAEQLDQEQGGLESSGHPPNFLVTQDGIVLPRLPATAEPEVTKTPIRLPSEHRLAQQSHAEPEPPKSPTVFPAIAIPQISKPVLHPHPGPPQSLGVFSPIAAAHPPEPVLHPQSDRQNNRDVQFLPLTEHVGSNWQNRPELSVELQEIEARMRKNGILGRAVFLPRDISEDVRDPGGRYPDREGGVLTQMARFDPVFDAAGRNLEEQVRMEGESAGRQYG